MAESANIERMCIPEDLSFDRINLILMAYLKAGADRKAVSYRDASLRSGVSHYTVSKNNKFFAFSGFLTEEAKGRLKLTEKGAKYAQLLDWGKHDEAREQLGEILKECSLVGIILDYSSGRGEVTKDDLRRHIGSVVQVPREARFTVGINALIDMLVFSGLLQEEGQMLRRGVEKAVTPQMIEVKRPITTKPSPFGTFGGLEVMKSPSEVSIPISLTVNITDATDIQKLKQILKAIREELFEKKETDQ